MQRKYLRQLYYSWRRKGDLKEGVFTLVVLTPVDFFFGARIVLYLDFHGSFRNLCMSQMT